MPELYFTVNPNMMKESNIELINKAINVEMIVDEVNKVVHIKTETDLSSAGYAEKSSKQAFEKAKKEALDKADKIKEESLSLPWLQRLDDVARWGVEPHSSRKASLDITAISAGVPALRIVFKEGRGDTMYIGSPITINSKAQGLRIRTFAKCADAEAVSLGLVLTTERERPWLELAPMSMEQGIWKDLEFPLAGINMGANMNKLDKVNKIVLAVKSNSDAGYLLVEKIDPY